MTHAELEREVRQLRRYLGRLADVLHKHTRTDLAPDAALPQMRRLADEIKEFERCAPIRGAAPKRRKRPLGQRR